MAESSGAFSNFCFLFLWFLFVHLDHYVFGRFGCGIWVGVAVGLGIGDQSQFAVNRSDLLMIEHGII